MDTIAPSQGASSRAATEICPVIFGAPRANKRFLLLNLAAHYSGVDALREGVEILRLYDV